MPDINVNKLSEALNTKADIDLNNTGVFSTSERGGVSLTSSTPANANGKEVTSADFIKSDIQSNLLNYTTNRILEIPQDIKLELNNGTLTLKAGSKVYVPNGFEADGTTPKFDVVTIASDATDTRSFNTNYKLQHLYDVSNSSFGNPFQIGFNLFSGSTAPSGFKTQINLWYDTSANLMKYTNDNGSNWSVVNYSLPLCVFSSPTNITSIDQVFNGFGYIGSTLFLLPGVKTVVPDGRNENGTCKNKAPSTVASVKTETIRRADTAYMFTNFVSSVIATHHYVCSKTKPTVTTTTLWYNPETNLPSQVLSDGTVMTPYEEIPIAKFTSDSTGKITSFEPYSVDSVANSNASNFSQAGRSYLSGLGMPSNRYIDLTLGASGSTYTAPANGWFTLHKGANSVGQYVYMNTTGIDIGTCFNVSSGTDIPSYFLPVKAGDTVKIDYTLGGETKQFRFIYSQGDQ